MIKLSPFANPISNVTWESRSSYGIKVSDALGLINDIRNRIRRLTYGHSDEDKAVITINADGKEPWIEGATSVPAEYDNKTAATTCKKLWTKLRSIMKDPANKLTTDHDPSEASEQKDKAQEDLSFLIDEVKLQNDDIKVFKTSVQMLQQCAEKSKLRHVNCPINLEKKKQMS